MNILAKYKKMGHEGFKNFVFNLESLENSKMKTIILATQLEDPVYMEWIEKNITPFSAVLSLTQDELFLILGEIKSAERILVAAFHSSPEQDHFLNNLLPLPYASRYKEEVESIGTGTISKVQNLDARRQLLVKMRELQESRGIKSAKWQYPKEEILCGAHCRPPLTGPFELKYENGKAALIGKYERKMREGLWLHYYSNGQKLAEGIYIREEKNGDWSFYDNTGKCTQKGRYINDSKTGIWEYQIGNEIKKIDHT